MKFGLIGKSLSHSFSKRYFSHKFEREGLHAHQYQNFELQNIAEFPQLLHKETQLKGLNITVPYKKAIIPYLQKLSAQAETIGAVNTVAFTGSGLWGHNTDWWGFTKSIEPLLQTHHQRCLVLGTGGASAAVAYALEQMGMTYLLVSRQPQRGQISYEEAGRLLSDHFVLINCTPLGTWPQVNELVPLNLEALGEKHLVYDLVYNPPQSQLLVGAEKRGAKISNGHKMLEFQAEKAWAIWNEL